MSGLDTGVCRLLGTRYPIVQAPMAGGFTTPELVAAVSNAGALGSLGGATLGPDELRDAIGAIRRLTDRPFAVNLFAQLPPPEADTERVAAMQAVLAPLRAELGLSEPQDVPSAPSPGLVEAQLAVVADERVPVFSFTFGTLSLEAVREAGSVILGTATTVAEAVELERLGVDAIVAQSGEAGGHRRSPRARRRRRPARDGIPRMPRGRVDRSPAQHACWRCRQDPRHPRLLGQAGTARADPARRRDRGRRRRSAPVSTSGNARRRAASCRARGGSPGSALRARGTGLGRDPRAAGGRARRDAGP